MPKVVGDSRVLFIFDKPEEEDVRFRELGSGSRSRVVDGYCKSVGITDYEMWSVVRCIPYATEYTDDKDKSIEPTIKVGCAERLPEKDEVEACKPYLEMGIFKRKPKLLVTVGGNALEFMTGKKESMTRVHGTLKTISVMGEDYQLMPIYSPTYLSNNKSPDVMSDFMQDMGKIKSIIDGTWIDITESNEVTYAKTYRDFKEFYVKNLRGEPMLAYDIETNAEPVYSEDFDIIGFSLAKRHCGIYVCLESLEYQMPARDLEMSRKLLVQILRETPKIIVHNSLYERPATYYNLRYEMDFDKVEDTLVMAKLMLGGKTGAGLKPNAKKIGYPDWDAELDDYISNFLAFLKRSTLVKYNKVFDNIRDGKSFLDFMDELDEEALGYVNPILDIIGEHYSEDEVPNVVSLFSKSFLKAHDEGIPGTIPYSWIPSTVICSYGATDALATFDLYDYYMKRFDDESTDEVDLHKGYNFSLMEHFAGYELMLSGMAINDDAAQLDKENYEGVCLTTMKFLLSDPKVEKMAVDTHFWEYVPEVIYNDYNDYFWDTFGRRVVTATDRDGNTIYKMEYKVDDTKTRSKHIKHLKEGLDIPESINNELNRRVLQKIRSVVSNASHYTELKTFLNPGSPAVKDICNKILITDDTKTGKFINSVNAKILSHEDFDITNYSNREQKLISAISDYVSTSKDDLELVRSKYNELKEVILLIDDLDTQDMKDALNESKNLNYSKFDDEGQVDAYSNLAIGPVDPEIPETWPHEMKWVIDYRLYKKSLKIITSYIEGATGRSSMYQVDKKRFTDGEDVVYREKAYFDCKLNDRGKAELPSDKVWVEQTNFGVGTAETGRWRSSLHTLPMGSSIKKLYVSRFSGGTILQPDFSANELRCVASAAQEENMLEAFRNGVDIHQSNASRIFKVPMEEVTSFQRRRAKALCVRGDTKIRLVSGKTEKIEDLYNANLEPGKTLVLSYSRGGNAFEANPIMGVYQNREETDYVEVVLATGKKIRCTPDHLFMLIDEKYVQAQNLKQGDNLMSFNTQMRVHNVKWIHSDEPVKFYDLTVDHVHNFMIDCGDGEGIIVHNSFSTLYGATEYSVANTYFNGDMGKAKDLMDSFFGAFPNLKVWIEARHKEVKETHKVSVLTNRFLHIDFDPKDKKSMGLALRQSQNFPIQSTHFSTEILGLDGKSHKIGELAENHEDLWIYSYDLENNRIIPVKGIQAQCTGETDTWYEIFLDNGKSVKVTPEHKMMLRNGEYQRADELSVGDSLMPLYIHNQKFGSDYDMLELDGQHVHVMVHDYVYGNIPNTHIHHINMDIKDNRPENLVRLTVQTHMKFHREFYEYCMGNRNLDDVLEPVIDELKLHYGDRWEERLNDFYTFINSLTDKDKKKFSEKSMTHRNKVREEKFPEWDSNQKEAIKNEVARRVNETGNALGVSSDEYHRILSDNWDKNYDERVEKLKIGHSSPEAKKNHSEASKIRESNPDYQFNRLKKMLGFVQENNLPWETPEDWDKSISLYENKKSRRYSKFIDKSIGWDNFVQKGKEYLSTYNHKIVDIKIHHLDKPEKKYDLHIPKYHNFALECGVFTHNSAASTIAAVILCKIAMYYKENNLKSKTICFIHDSLESDVAPYELLQVIDYEKEILAHGGQDYFGVALKADVSMGYSMGHECELVDLEILDEAKTEANITLSGFKDEIMDTVNNWKLAYNVVDVYEEDYKPTYTPVAQTFEMKKAYDPTVMTHRLQGTAKIHIRYYDEHGNINPITDKLELTNLWENAPLLKYLS